MKKLTKETIKILKFNWGLRTRLYAEANKLRAEGSKLYAEGNKLRAEGNKLWAETILEFCGNIRLEWKSDAECHLEDGTVFK